MQINNLSALRFHDRLPRASRKSMDYTLPLRSHEDVLLLSCLLDGLVNKFGEPRLFDAKRFLLQKLRVGFLSSFSFIVKFPFLIRHIVVFCGL